jgi:hypothetical protein
VIRHQADLGWATVIIPRTSRTSYPLRLEGDRSRTGRSPSRLARSGHMTVTISPAPVMSRNGSPTSHPRRAGEAANRREGEDSPDSL